MPFSIVVPLPSPRKLIDAYKRWRTPPPKALYKKVFKDYQTGLYRTASRLSTRPDFKVPKITSIPADVERPEGCTLPIGPPHRDTNVPISISISNGGGVHIGDATTHQQTQGPTPPSSPFKMKMPQHGPHRTSKNHKQTGMPLRSFDSWAKNRVQQYARVYASEYGGSFVDPNYVKFVQYTEGDTSSSEKLNEKITNEILEQRKEFIRDASDPKEEMAYQRKKMREAFIKHPRPEDTKRRTQEISRRWMIQEIIETNMLEEAEEKERQRWEQEHAQELQRSLQAEKERAQTEEARRLQLELELEQERARRAAQEWHEKKKKLEEEVAQVGRKRRQAEKLKAESERMAEQLRRDTAEQTERFLRERIQIERERAQVLEECRRVREQRAQAEVEEEARRKQAKEEQARAQQAFEEALNNTRLRTGRSIGSHFIIPADVSACFELYERKWDMIIRTTTNPSDGEVPKIIPARDLPWPVLGRVKNCDDITCNLVKEFIEHPSRLQDCINGSDDLKKMKKRVIKTELLKWHPDKFAARIGGRLADCEREAVMECAERVARWLNDMMKQA